ncbi:MAG: LptF/LptG family permease [Treponema sp.]|nr:LptF/LptG family permease [Treponema sp.]
MKINFSLLNRSKISSLVLRLKSKEPGSRILIKYLYKELLSYFLVCFAFFFVVFFANTILLIGEQLLSKHAPFFDVCKIMFYSTPQIISQSAPFATLVGFLMCLGRMVSDNEILIFRASGFSFRTIFRPVIILGIIISLVSFLVNDYFLPLGTKKYNQLMTKISRSTPTVILEPNSVKRLGRSTIVIGDVAGEKVSDIIFFSKGSDGYDNIIIAKNSILTDAKSEGVLMQLNMDDAIFTSIASDNKSTYNIMKSDKMIMNIFDSVFSSGFARSPREMTFIDLRKEIQIMKKGTPKGHDYKLNAWLMEYYKKFARPFSSIFFAFLAFSISFLFAKHNGLTLGLVVGILLCVLYWAMDISGQLLVIRVELNSFWCIWLPNILVGVIGFILSLFLVKK